MVEYRVLYYPDFSPKSIWLRRVLMLSDNVLRMVPSDVKPQDSDDLRQLQDTIPGCLTSVPPIDIDVAIEPRDESRFTRAFEVLGRKSKKDSSTIEFTVSPDGLLSMAGHVFLHDGKLSHFIEHQLRRNGLLIDSFRELTPSGRFVLVRKEASDIILAGLASRMARRLGVDAITDQPMPFAVAALQGVPQRVSVIGAAEGALLSAIATMMIPASVASIEPRKYRQIRESYAGIREAFKALTAELAARQRLNRIDSPEEFAKRVDAVAREFAREYRQYRSSRYARRFKLWTPLCIGGILSIPTALVSPHLAAEFAIASFTMQLLQNYLGAADSAADQRVFHMLAGLRRDVINRSGIRELI
jgi:hypothetical protein